MARVGDRFRAQVEDATDNSIFGNMEYPFEIFQIAHDGRFMIEIVNKGPPATGYITNDQLDLLKGKKGVLQITKQVMMRGEPEYYLTFVERAPAAAEEGVYDRQHLIDKLNEAGYSTSSPEITKATTEQLRRMLEEEYKTDKPPPLVDGENQQQYENRVAQYRLNKAAFKRMGWGGRRRKTKKSKRRARKTRRRHK